MPAPRDSWTFLKLRVPPESEDLLPDLLGHAASTADVPFHGSAHQGLDPATGQDLWLAYTDTEADAHRLATALREACLIFGLEDPQSHPQLLAVEKQLREPWHEAWREHFQPVELADTARIVPPWLRGTGDPSGPPEIVIDPGMAFGTGTHPTTQLALTLGIETLRHLPEASVLDVGTGSAILAIAALKHGAQRVTTTDLDPDVAPNVVDNLRLNSLLPEGEPVFEPESAYELLHHHPAFRLHIGPLTDSPLGPGLHHLGTPWDGPFDLVFCNMLQHEFTPLLPQFPACLRPGGKVILSGFLAQDLEELLQDLIPAGLEPAGPCMIRGDWGGLAVQARPTP